MTNTDTFFCPTCGSSDLLFDALVRGRRQPRIVEVHANHVVCPACWYEGEPATASAKSAPSIFAHNVMGTSIRGHNPLTGPFAYWERGSRSPGQRVSLVRKLIADHRI